MNKRFGLYLIVTLLVLLIAAACSQGPVNPQGGITIGGTVAMDRADSAEIYLDVSADAANIESVSLTMTNLKCEGFSAGSWMTTVSSQTPITDGEFLFKSDNVGEISGKFTSPTTAEGTIHLAPFSGNAECGNWNWTAEFKQ